MTRLLSTKILSQGFKDRLLTHSFSLVEKSFIKISPIKNLKLADSNQAIIFSSQNAVKIALDNSEIKSLVDQKPIYCIGKKTALLLVKNGQKVVKIAQNSSKVQNLAEQSIKILKKFKKIVSKKSYNLKI